jgi:hypothetical protein
MNAYAKYFFLRKVDEVRWRMQTGDYFDMIMAAALLRHLVLDEAPLLHKANRDLKLKLEFEVSRPLAPIPPHIPKPIFQMPNIDPQTAPPGFPTEIVGLDRLLGYHVLSTHGHDFTVKDVLKNCAHVRGGVHLGEPQQCDLLLFEADGLEIGGHPSAMLALRQIANVLLKGVEPLAEAVLKQLQEADQDEPQRPQGCTRPSAW